MTDILVVDDSAVDRRLVGGLLERHRMWKVRFAADGSEALAAMRAAVPDVVVTDLQMPEMDGLELVAAARVHHEHVPVILITAHGSEALAVEALQRGAATYVPKTQLADRLEKTVEDVLAMTKADRSYARLIGCLDSTSFTFSLDNDPELIDALVDLVQRMVVSVGLCDFNGRLQVGVALKEALANAMLHGNLELTPEQLEQDDDEAAARLLARRRKEPPYCDRVVLADLNLSREEARMLIRDEGPGFDVANLPQAGQAAVAEHSLGRGLCLMQAFMDEVTFNGVGNEVLLVKRCAEPDAPETDCSAPTVEA